jgi:hypothetical protein
MNRLQSELQRLYLPRPATGSGLDPAQSGLIDQHGQVRALVLELARPADWEELSKVWRGMHADLELPAPGIAVSGTDGFQLWFSLAEPVSVAQAHLFLESVRSRYLPDIAPNRVTLLPAVDATTPGQVRHARLVPAQQAQSGYWSAFVSPDLAPVFAETPWMDIQPGNDGQAGVVSRLQSITQPEFEAVLERFGPDAPRPGANAPEPIDTGADRLRIQSEPAAASQNPKQFLLRVMNDDNAPLALRIEAAKALLPYSP